MFSADTRTGWGSAGLKTVCTVYRGLVPMSPKTTPRAPSASAAWAVARRLTVTAFASWPAGPSRPGSGRCCHSPRVRALPRGGSGSAEDGSRMRPGGGVAPEFGHAGHGRDGQHDRDERQGPERTDLWYPVIDAVSPVQDEFYADERQD